MRALVTGGAGFIGSRLANALVEQGEDVRVVDNFDPLAHPDGARARLSDAVELVEGDLRDPDVATGCMRGIEQVFHLGGVVGNGESMVNVARAVSGNSLATANLLEAAIRERGSVRRLVVASSMVVYGEGTYRCSDHGRISSPRRTKQQLERRAWEPLCPGCGAQLEPLPVRETDPLRPLSVYGITKRDQEELALTLGEAYGMETVALRYLNVYGAGQALGNPYTGVAAIFAARVLAGSEPLVFEDGGQIRDLVHVDDVVRATLAAMESPAAAGCAINVATGRRVTVLELANRIVAALNGKIEPKVTGEFRAGDIRHCYADTARARELLEFEARISLEQGLPELAAWVARQRSTTDRSDDALAGLRAAGLVT